VTLTKRFLLPVVVATLAISVCEQGHSQEANSSDVRRIHADEVFAFDIANKHLMVKDRWVVINGHRYAPKKQLPDHLKLKGFELEPSKLVGTQNDFEARDLSNGDIELLKKVD
jgi:hypothetical protein